MTLPTVVAVSPYSRHYRPDSSIDETLIIFYYKLFLIIMLTDKDIRALLVKYASQSLSSEDEKLLDSLKQSNRKKLYAVIDAELAAYDHPGIIPEDLKQLEKLKSELRFLDKLDDPNHWTNRYPRIYRALLNIILIIPLLYFAFMIYKSVRWLFS